MVTNILIMKDYFLNNSKNKKDYNKKIKKYYQQKLSKVFDGIVKDAFILKYHDLMSLYLLRKQIDPSVGTKLKYVDEDYDYYTLKYKSKYIDITIEISVCTLDIILNIVEKSGINEVVTRCEFTNKIRYSDYNEETKDKVTAIVALCNTLIKEEYINLLYFTYWDKEYEFNDKFDAIGDIYGSIDNKEDKGWFKKWIYKN